MASKPPPSDQLESAIGGIRSQAVKDTLRAKAAEATASSDEAEKARLLQLAKDIRANQGALGWPVLLFGTAVIGLLVWFLSTLTGESALTNVATGRPILMLVVVITTVVFGGMMLNAALFGQQSDNSAQRFQQAREIFLVFSGICATVVGFYFGSGTVSQQAAAQVSLNASLGPDGTITATVAGGAPPYTVALVAGGKTLPFAVDPDDATTFTLPVDPDVCPAGGNYQVTATGAPANPPIEVSFTTDELKPTWTKCAGGGETAAEASGGATTSTTETPSE